MSNNRIPNIHTQHAPEIQHILLTLRALRYVYLGYLLIILPLLRSYFGFAQPVLSVLHPHQLHHRTFVYSCVNNL